MAELAFANPPGSNYFSLASTTYSGNARPFHDYADNLATGHYDSRVKDLRGGLNSQLYAPQAVSTAMEALPNALISTGGGRTDELLRVYPPSIHLNGRPVEYFPGNMGPRPAGYPYEPIQTRSGVVYNYGNQSLLSTGSFAGRRYLDSGFPRQIENGLTSTRVDRVYDTAPLQASHRYAGPYSAALATGGAKKVTLASFAPIGQARTYGGTYTSSVGGLGGLSVGAYGGVQPYTRQYATPESYVSGGYLRSSPTGYTLPSTYAGTTASYAPGERRVIPLNAAYRSAFADNYASSPAVTRTVVDNYASSPALTRSMIADTPAVYRSMPAAAAAKPLSADESYA